MKIRPITFKQACEFVNLHHRHHKATVGCKFCIGCFDDDRILLQLAEEASELSQAALKLRRLWAGVNPSPMTWVEAKDNLLEEIADIIVCLRALELNDIERHRIDHFYEDKLKRWKERLEI